MAARIAIGRGLLALLAVAVIWGGTSGLYAQEEESPEVAQYRVDYERYEKIMGIKDPMKRSDELYAFLKERANSKLVANARSEYLQILEGYFKVDKFETLIPLAERMIKLAPNVGETYYFHGAALKELKRYPEAMNALAKCYVIRNPASEKAKTFLEFIYKGLNKGSLAGLEKVIQKAREEIRG